MVDQNKPNLGLDAGAGNALKTLWLLLLFFASGFSALVYQVCWQRALFTLTGTDLESTTIIVVLFMLGLGGGALAGGQIADRLPGRRLQFFAATECVIGLYGLCSLGIISFLGDMPLGAGLAPVFFKAAIALLPPTLLMGTTLPILVAHLYETERNIGVSIGKLYTTNTFGAAMGAASTGFLLFSIFGLSGSVTLAAAVNIAISLIAWMCLSRRHSL